MLLGIFLAAGSSAHAQGEHANSGTATYLSHDDLMALKQKSASQPTNDSQAAVVDVNNGEYHIGLGIGHRSKASVNSPSDRAVEHNEVTEVYYIISGSGILTTGGTIKDVKPGGGQGGPSGPSAFGGEIIGGVSKPVGPGDIVVIPPNTPHRFSQIDTDEIVYALVRPDPHKVLPLMSAPGK
jgi:mannose-6-phosphate isomerase-like protein (cupin superfamily)